MAKEFVADALDLDILRELRENSKQPLRELAKKLGAHPNTIMQRVRRLENEKIILKYIAEVDYRRLGFDFHALALVKVKKGIIGDASQITDIINFSQVQALYAVTGTFDLVALLRAKNRDELSDVLRKMQSNNIITKTNTVLVLYTYKQPYEYNPLL